MNVTLSNRALGLIIAMTAYAVVISPVNAGSIFLDIKGNPQLKDEDKAPFDAIKDHIARKGDVIITTLFYEREFDRPPQILGQEDYDIP